MPPVGGVWGKKPSSATAAGAADRMTESALNEELANRFDKIGLDGIICSEYILSLIEMYPVAADRAAAISDFVSDSIGSSDIASRDHEEFVDETINMIEGRLSFAKRVAAPAGGAAAQGGLLPTPGAPLISTNEPPKRVGFKKGTKLTGMALKEVVGDMRPSFVQLYSDDETAGGGGNGLIRQLSRNVSSVSSNLAPVNRRMSEFSHLVISSSSSSSSSSATPTSPVAPSTPSNPRSARKKKTSAREIGPDEVWSGDEVWTTPLTSLKPPGQLHPATRETTPAPTLLEKNRSKKSLSVTGFNSVTISPPPPPPPAKILSPVVVAKKPDSPMVPKTRNPKVPVTLPPAEVSAVTPKMAVAPPVSVLDTTPPAQVLGAFEAFHLPTDILNFDFKFEDEVTEEVVPVAAAAGDPIDLLRQMFSGFGTTPIIIEEPPVVVTPPAGLTASSEVNVYAPVLMLNVLAQMGEFDVPSEIAKLRSEESSSESVESHPNERMSEKDGSWRRGASSVDKLSKNGNTRSKTWKNSGYKPHGKSKDGIEVNELHNNDQEGFW